MKHLISLSSISLVLVLFFITPLTQSVDLIDETCKKTPYYGLCILSLRSHPQAYNADIKTLASIMANITLSSAADTLFNLQGLIDHKIYIELEQILTYCAEVYIPVVRYILPQAIDALLHGYFAFAKDGVLYAEDEIKSCQQKFPNSVKLPFIAMNRIMQNLCEVSATIINSLH